MAAGGEFVEGWLVAQVLGEGAYGECVVLPAIELSGAGDGGSGGASLKVYPPRAVSAAVAVAATAAIVAWFVCPLRLDCYITITELFVRLRHSLLHFQEHYRVRLLVHSRTGACVALKAVRAGEGGAREAALHRALRHPHVLRCLGERRHNHLHYLFLEYAQGGELFDRIEPDAGMAPPLARRYWRQLLAGLRYLHERGIAHRDIKPENLLLDHADDLKISDFGMATLFRHGSRERLLSRVCGTAPYAAPEVLGAELRPYRAPPADLWAAALVLLAMLAGELPWERANNSDARFTSWCRWAGGDGAPAACPGGVWLKVGAGALAVLRLALQPDPARRASLPALLSNPWLVQSDTDSPSRRDGTHRVWCSQPLPGAAADAPDARELSAADMDALLSYSQPAHADDLLLSSPPDLTQATQATQGGSGVLQRLVRRMTRVWVRCDEASALRALADLLDEKRYTWRRIHPRIFAIDCGDEVRMRAWALPVCEAGEARAVLEFRRSRGCGLAFKRRYLELRQALQGIATATPPRPDALSAPLHALAPTAHGDLMDVDVPVPEDTTDLALNMN